jgi:hypothetical protein
MSVSFDPIEGVIIIPVELQGPFGSAVLRLAPDTGATSTVVNVGLLVALGYDPALAPDRLQVTTGSGVEFAPRIILESISALGEMRPGFPVLAHTLPPSADATDSSVSISSADAGFLWISGWVRSLSNE